MVTMYDDDDDNDADVDVGDDDMAMEVQTINSIRHKILTPLQYSRCFIILSSF